MSAGGPPMCSREEAELLSCRKAVEFATDAGFSKLVIEGDNSNVMKALSSFLADQSLLGNVVDDVRHLVFGMHWIYVLLNRSQKKRKEKKNRMVHRLESSLYQTYL
ncbi:hypothetical protein SO802_010150 [Lithocarpus litseifolius]|uniref:RNase H type-1 domain-containing protein n=1 Tax=Lithocarpus litseifolius TaxID=425828 RepID=A0AAW2DGF7_9ROSI